MNLNDLPKITKRKNKRVGRGIGSGKGGHTTGRGTKGQKARGKVPQIFEGTKTKKSFVKRVPLLRGKAKFKPWGVKPVVFNVGDFADWPEKTTVTEANMVKAGWIKDGQKVKVLGDGELKTAVTFKVAVTKSAQAKIEAAGGKISQDE